MTISRTAADLGAAVRAARLVRGWTQAELAERAGIGRQWVVTFERGHERAELAKVLSVVEALGLVLHTEAVPVEHDGRQRSWLTAGDLARAIRSEVEAGDTSFALRLLGRGLADLRCLNDHDDRASFLSDPPSTGDPRWDVLLAAAVARECRALGIPAPAWTDVTPLPSWWFPVHDPVLVARTLQRTPIDLAVRGIWLDGAALEVA